MLGQAVQHSRDTNSSPAGWTASSDHQSCSCLDVSRSTAVHESVWITALFFLPFFTCFSMFSEGQPWMCLIRLSSKWAAREGVKDPGASAGVWPEPLQGTCGRAAPGVLESTHRPSWLLERDNKWPESLSSSTYIQNNVITINIFHNWKDSDLVELSLKNLTFETTAWHYKDSQNVLWVTKVLEAFFTLLFPLTFIRTQSQKVNKRGSLGETVGVVNIGERGKVYYINRLYTNKVLTFYIVWNYAWFIHLTNIVVK